MSKDPKMKGCSATLHYRSDDGFSSKQFLSSTHMAEGSDKSRGCWINIADEVARIAELFGFGDEVEGAVKQARARVKDWRARQ